MSLACLQDPQPYVRERYTALTQNGFGGVQSNPGTIALVMRSQLCHGNSRGAVDVYAVACAHGAQHDVACVTLLQTALAALTQPELLQPELAQTVPDSPFDSAPQLSTMAAADEVSAAPDSDMPDMGRGCLPASLLSELVGAPPVATSASGAPEASFAAPSKPPGSGTCAVWAPPGANLAAGPTSSELRLPSRSDDLFR
jgi:hypothetical protein